MKNNDPDRYLDWLLTAVMTFAFVSIVALTVLVFAVAISVLFGGLV